MTTVQTPSGFWTRPSRKRNAPQDHVSLVANRPSKKRRPNLDSLNDTQNRLKSQPRCSGSTASANHTPFAAGKQKPNSNVHSRTHSHLSSSSTSSHCSFQTRPENSSPEAQGVSSDTSQDETGETIDVQREEGIIHSVEAFHGDATEQEEQIAALVHAKILQSSLFFDCLDLSCPRTRGKAKSGQRQYWINSEQKLLDVWESITSLRHHQDPSCPKSLPMRPQQKENLLRTQSLYRGHLSSFCRKVLDLLFPGKDLNNIDTLRELRHDYQFHYKNGKPFEGDAPLKLFLMKHLPEDAKAATAVKNSRKDNPVLSSDFLRSVNKYLVCHHAAVIKYQLGARRQSSTRPNQAWDWYQARHDIEKQLAWWDSFVEPTQQDFIIEQWRDAIRQRLAMFCGTPSPDLDEARLRILQNG